MYKGFNAKNIINDTTYIALKYFRRIKSFHL